MFIELFRLFALVVDPSQVSVKVDLQHLLKSFTVKYLISPNATNALQPQNNSWIIITK